MERRFQALIAATANFKLAIQRTREALAFSSPSPIRVFGVVGQGSR
jgi:hypothetical protein